MLTPPCLGAFLDYGGDLAGFPGLTGLAEAVVVSRRLNTPAQNGAQAAFSRDCVARWVADGPGALTGPEWDGVDVTQAMVTAFAWAAECYEDDVLADRFERALPVDLYLEHIEWVTERRARAADR
jgi:hypothetical protein